MSSPLTSTSSSEPIMAKGRRFCERKSEHPFRSLKTWISYPQLAVIDDRLFIVLLDIVREVVDGDIIVLDILHDLCQDERINSTLSVLLANSLTRFLNTLSSLGVSESAFPMTGMTLTRGERRRMSSISISRRLETNW